MATCMTCKTGGQRMKQCQVCKSVFCTLCDQSKKGIANNKCPTCGTRNDIKPAP